MREPIVSNPGPTRSADTSAAANGTSSNGDAEVAPWAAFTPARGRFVRTVIVFSIALTLLAAASIYWRWANVYEPTSYITVQGDESLNGTMVAVTSPEFPDSNAWGTLSKDNNYNAAIFLHPGTYTVTATLNDKVLARAPFSVSGRRAAVLNLVTRPQPSPAGSGHAP